MDILSNYQGWRKCHVILVFDAYRVKGNPGSVEKYHNIHVVYTKEAETADMYIEKATYEIAREHRVRVATSDGLEQVIILGHGAQAYVRQGAAALRSIRFRRRFAASLNHRGAKRLCRPGSNLVSRVFL